jgi:hypothetical protein
MSGEAGTGMPSAWGWGADDDEVTCQVIECLSAEFVLLPDPDTVTTMVQQCRRDLDTEATPASPEAIEELARRRLRDTTGAYTVTGVVERGPAAGSYTRLVFRYLSD